MIQEPEPMLLHEAILNSNTGDEIQGKGHKFIMSDSGVLYYKAKENETAIKAVLMKHDFKEKEWFVIPSKLKVLTAEEYASGVYINKAELNSFYKSLVISSFEFGHKNGRLERDIELRPVIEKVKRYMENHGCNDFSMVINNLKPLIQE